MEIKGIDEILLIAESTGSLLDPLDLGIERFAGGVGDLMLQIREDIVEPVFQRSRHLSHRPQTTA